MVALYRSGRQADALDAYRAARRTLVDELGIEPGPALQELERAVLDQSLELHPATAESAPERPPEGEPTPTSLPPELTSLIGREPEAERVAELTVKHRLTTLVGPGGVGKTRVAQRIGRDLAGSFEHGVWFVDLSANDQEIEVASAVLSQVGISEQPDSTSLDTAAAELRGRRLLLVFDNCEHVLRARPPRARGPQTPARQAAGR
jgi:hypothetical protein